MEYDPQLRAADRAIYDVYPTESWSAVGFDEGERFRTVNYRQAVGAQQARCVLDESAVQPQLFVAGSARV